MSENKHTPEPVDTTRGFSLWFDREAWGHIFDGLMLERERSLQRKSANPESNSNLIAERCAELMNEISAAAQSYGEPEKSAETESAPAIVFFPSGSLGEEVTP
jgi:hypothetical protein